MRKFKTFLAIMTAALLAACGSDGNNNYETESVPTVQSTEKVSEASETTAKTTAAPETTSETKADTEEPYTDKPEMIPSDRVYEIYPVRLIYPEEKKELPMEKVSFSDQVCSEDGTVIYVFSAEYPMFTLDDKAVADKINKTIESYVMGELEKGKGFAAEETDLYSDMAPIYGFIFKDTIRFDDMSSMWDHYSYSVNGNLLSVYLESEGYHAGAAHGVYDAINFVFDMNTGDVLNFGNIIGDMDGFSKAVMKGIFINYSGGGSMEEYREYVGDSDIKDSDMTYRITVRDGALGYYILPYEYGSFGDGIRCIKIPISEALEYFTDEGRKLFSGAVSAEAVPAKIIKYRGKQYSEVGYPPDFSDKELAAEDYEFMRMFPETILLSFTGCRNIDFEKIAAMENIRILYLNDCEFDDISPLFGSNIDYIRDSGYNISKEQAEEFIANGGEYVASRLFMENNTEVNDE